jgi:hypothetical protein
MMKRTDFIRYFLAGALLVCMAFLTTCASGPAELVAGTDIPVNKARDFEYTDQSESIWIKDYKGKSTVVGIPAFIKGKPVTIINDYAFRGKGLTAVGIPGSVQWIGDQAFADNQLTEIIIPEGVTHIGSSAFANNQLTKVGIPGSVKWIDNQAFADNQLTEIIIPEGVTHIGNSAFANNKLTVVTIPDSVETIGGANIVAGNPLSSPLVLPGSVKTIKFDNGLLGRVWGEDTRRINIFEFSFGYSTPRMLAIPSEAYGIPVTSISPDKPPLFYEKSIDELILPASIEKIAFNTFRACNIRKVSPANTTMAALWNEYKARQDQADELVQRQKQAEEREKSKKWLGQLQEFEEALEQMSR